MNKISTEELFKIAYNHLQNKNYSKSIELFNKILTHFPENLSVLRNLLHAYAFSGDFHTAENTIKKVLKLNEKEPYVYQFYALFLMCCVCVALKKRSSCMIHDVNYVILKNTQYYPSACVYYSLSFKMCCSS